MIDDTRVFSRMLAFGLAAIGVFYATMTTLQLASGAPPVHQWMLAYPIEALSFFGVVPVLMFLATKFPWAKLPAIIYFHIAAIITSVWFTEVYSPFTVFWTMYTLVSAIYFGWKGFIGSTLALFIMAAWYVFGFASTLLPSFTVYAILSLLVCTITTATSFLFARVIKSGQTKNIALQKAEMLEQQRANQLNALLNSIREPVFTVDATGLVTSQNSPTYELFNTKDTYVGRRVDEVLPLRTRDGREIKITELMQTFPQTLTRDDFVLVTGTLSRYVELQMSRIPQTNQQAGGVVIMVRDITKQKTLEDEKDEFISVTSHELRTPIAVIEGGIGNLEMLRSKHIDDNRFDDAIKTARQQIQNLARIVNDISTISSAEKGGGNNVDDISLPDLLSELHEKFKVEAESRSLTLRLEIPENLPTIVTSKQYLNGILSNFIKNAITYTRAGGVRVKVGFLSDGRVCVDVIDTGIGISPEDQKRIFEKFYRSEDYRTRETGGTGLGLYEAKILATKIDAYIQVVSAVDKGSAFRLTLPTKAIKLQMNKPQYVQKEPQPAAQ